MITRTIPVLLAALVLGACATEGGGAGAGAGAGGLSGVTAATGGAFASPKDLVGKSGLQITSAFGAPAFLRKDGEAQIWQYRGTNCLLDVFLYKDGTGYKVKYAELRRRARGELTESACLANAVFTGKAKG